MRKPFSAIRRRIPLPVLITGIAVLAAAALGLAGFGLWHEFGPADLRGIDASHYQGDISWRAVAEDRTVHFVYLKATEGKAYRDPDFSRNWSGAASYGLKVGAYHYFSASSTGEAQAENFIAAVPKAKGKLPPAIDIEYSITKQTDFKQQLADYVRLITSHYGQKPVFYVTTPVYNALYDNYVGYPFWIINYKGAPDVNGWTLWQYSKTGMVGGIDGKVDLNRFQGSRWAFGSLLSK